MIRKKNNTTDAADSEDAASTDKNRDESADSDTPVAEDSEVDVIETGKEIAPDDKAAGTEDVDIAAEDKAEEEPEETESERFLRLAAEFDNYKKRTAREFEGVIKNANIRLLRSLVEIVDNFERALSTETEENNSEAFRKGIELIYNQLKELLASEQVTLIESVGKTFDPNLHEAMMQEESEEYDEGVISQEVQRGYKINDRVLRHARVVVSRGADKPEKEKDKKK